MSSIRVRLAVVFTLLVATILVGVGIATYELLRQNLLDEIRRDVAERAEMFRRANPEPPYDVDVFGAPDVFFEVVAESGTVVARSGNLGDRKLPVPDAARRGEVVEVHVADHPLFLTTRTLENGDEVIVARSPRTTYGALGSLRSLLTGVIGGGIVVTALASWLYARTAVRPIGRIIEAARGIRDSRDVTRRVESRGSGDEVGRLVDTFNEMLAELESAYASLDQSNQQMRQFLADCSHELRAPLSRIRSAVDLLARIDAGPADDTSAASDDAGFRSRTLADIAGETERMARMVRQLLTLARADAGATIELRPVCLADLLATTVRQAERMVDGVTLVPPPPGALDDIVVEADADHLEQVVLILLDNAFKYTPPPGEVRIETSRDDQYATITIADTGLGIPDEDAARVFERFYRGRNAPAATGTGLGLAIARWVIEQHGGRIDLVTEPGRGSRFSLVLPLAPSAARPED